jgi:integrase
MSDDPDRAVDRLRERIADTDDLSAADRDVLTRLSDEIRILGPSQMGAHQHEFILRRLFTMARAVEDVDLADALTDEGAARRYVAWINAEKTGSPETNKDYRVALRGLGRVLGDGDLDELPEALAWVPGGYPDNYDRTPDPNQMLRWDEDVLPMIESAHNARDKALVALAWDLGPRAGELFDLTVDAISDHDHGLQVTLEGKTGRRSPVLVPSTPYVRGWLDVHPRASEAGAPLWCTLKGGDPITNNRVRDILSERADAADVSRPVTPTAFRKSSASYLASQGVNQAHLEDHHGWARGSDIAARYVATFDDASEDAIAAAHGREVDVDDGADLAPIECPRCGRETPREDDFCVWCRQALGVGAVEDLKAREKQLREAVLRLVREDPSLVEDIKRVQDVMTVLDERPELHADAEAFVDALREE